MNVCFLCGALEPGKSGVGDYARRMAFALAKMGNEASLIACNDNFITQTELYIESQDGVQISTYRISNSIAEPDRFKMVKNHIDKINPDWISLQFVLFAFHNKGLPFTLHQYLKDVGSGRRWNVMFHELWVGTLQNSSLKFRLWGAVQRFIIKRILLTLTPGVVHTQTAFYKVLLQKMYRNVEYLALFSNIPDLYTNASSETRNARSVIRMVLFGAIHETGNLNLLIEDALQYEKNNQVRVVLQLLGRNGNGQVEWIEKWEKAGLQVEMLGEQPSHIVADVLSHGHIGLTTSAYPMIEKSSAVATMLYFHLPILCVSVFEAPRNLPFVKPPFQVFEVAKGCIKACLDYTPDLSSERDIDTVVNKFITDLERTAN